MSSATPGPRLRDPNNLTKLNGAPAFSRSVLVNHFSRTVDRLSTTTNFPKLQAFLPQNLFPWLFSYLKYAFTPRHPFPDYTTYTINGVYQLAPTPGTAAIKIAIAGDWATGTLESQTIAGLMSSTNADLTIHLGDVYYVGDAPEVAENCFGECTNNYAGVKWPHGTQGSFALNGNHEMYANGGPYFTTFLSSLGMPSATPGQLASFFCLETDDWRIIAIDTGYNSVGIPVLSLIPGINSIPAIGGDCHLQKSLLDWLRNTVQPKARRKGTLILSHHQYYTAFTDHAYTKPAKQLTEFFDDQEVVWIWGHEHRLGIYDKFHTDGGITAYGRCLGNGGMPVDLGTPDPKKAPLLLYDRDRSHPLENGVQVGQNGHLNLTMNGPVLTFDYRDIDNTQLLVESFTTDGSGRLSRSVLSDPGILKPPASS